MPESVRLTPGGTTARNRVTFTPSDPSTSATGVIVPLTQEPENTPRPRRRRTLVAGVAAAAILVAGGAVVAQAHKTVTLDVDGQVTRVTTFAGSVDSLLRAQGVRVGERDAVTPGVGARLRDGGDVVVRYGHELTIDADGAKTTAWVAALDADDALRRLAARGDDVRLVASRSGDRLALPLRLDADGGPVAVVADGQTQTVRDSGGGVAGVLERAGVSVDDDDLVSVVDAGVVGASGAGVAVWVQRVETKDVTETSAIAFQRVEQQDPKRYADLAPKVVQAGVDGAHTRVERVTTVDGEVTERMVVSESDAAPVDEVVAVGTKERPVKQPTAPAPAPATSSGGSSAAGSAPAPAPAAPAGDVWAALAQCESGGRVDAVSSNGLYYGLYQFTVSTWQSVGGSGLPSQASAEEQTQRAQALQARSGWGQWPACSRKLGLL
ncbi:resuscitation-promoting factor [Xylanimonas ulmi]|uniref:Uncharacterized protein YabE (DUF348 family) n=1 Tax=Xylanimonas ulmi TaxID=228973 RepID=A0A4Q7M307_9MICO|nr:resuscitation-promoting factor [Xylanibacterium ulmi]RZS61884.1 uncharacterized protein YabE (DUF348 family) [Xylanibacterium ulmi]